MEEKRKPKYKAVEEAAKLADKQVETIRKAMEERQRRVRERSDR